MKLKGPGPPDDPTSPTIITNDLCEVFICKNTQPKSCATSCQGSINNSTGSDEREVDSACVCVENGDSPIEHTQHDSFDWWFHKNNKNSNKFR